MKELLEDAGEFQEILSRTYDVPDELDEADLNAELDALTDELLEKETSNSMPFWDEIAAPPMAQQPVANPIMVRTHHDVPIDESISLSLMVF
jgi:charged multivesicular body protein 5